MGYSTHTWCIPGDYYYQYNTTTDGKNWWDRDLENHQTDDEWKKTHGPYDCRPWFGITPPPTYYQLEHMGTTTNFNFNSEEHCNITLYDKDGKPNGIATVNPKELYEENNKLKDKIKSLEEDLHYWKSNYQGVCPKKYRDDLERIKLIINQIDEEMKRRA